MEFDTLIFLVAILFFAGFYCALRPRRLFVLRVKAGGRVMAKGRIPGRSLQDVVGFVTGLRLAPGSRIVGVPFSGPGNFRLRILGGVHRDVQQQIRNYLYLPR